MILFVLKRKKKKEKNLAPAPAPAPEAPEIAPVYYPCPFVFYPPVLSLFYPCFTSHFLLHLLPSFFLLSFFISLSSWNWKETGETVAQGMMTVAMTWEEEQEKIKISMCRTS